ncbi:hypothetical protein WN943_005983 [Citrus x changshan-huyou]
MNELKSSKFPVEGLKILQKLWLILLTPSPDALFSLNRLLVVDGYLLNFSPLSSTVASGCQLEVEQESFEVRLLHFQIRQMNFSVAHIALRDRIFLSYAVVFRFLIPALVNVVVVNTEGKNEPLLEKHGINMWFFSCGDKRVLRLEPIKQIRPSLLLIQIGADPRL